VSTRYRPQMPVAAVSGSSVTATFLTEMNRYWFQPELPNMPYLDSSVNQGNASH